jgi:hypothetical protein
MSFSLEMLVFVLLLNVYHSTSTEQNNHDHVDPDKGFLFDNFPGYILDLPIDAKDVHQRTTKVSNKMDCVFACVGIPWCRSVNFKTTAQKNGLHICELISSDKHKHKKHLKQDGAFTHLSIKVRVLFSF